MNVLVTGANGQLGSDVVLKLLENNIDCVGIDREELDLTNFIKVNEYFKNNKYDVIVHCAAYTAVDLAESEKNICYDVNVNATRHLAQIAANNEIKLVYISTDYVFDGRGIAPFEVNDLADPVNYYGLTKYLGEELVRTLVKKHYIVRVSWIFGQNGHNFIKTMLKLFETKDEISVVDDQIGSPTSTKEIAANLCLLIKSEDFGVQHFVNEGYCSWFDLALEIKKHTESTTKINAISSNDYPTVAMRPKNSRLSKEQRKQCYQFQKWQQAVADYIKLLTNY
jgi:dTDP-4-dehydrorhamnose reductase